MRRLVALLLLGASPIPAALAQTAPAPAKAVRPAAAADPRLLAAQQAFDALPETERKAIQQDLGFATTFNGAALGTFGPLTFNGIQNFERGNNLTVDGILTPPERQALANAATNARRALRFSVLDEPQSRVKIGVPLSVFVKRESNATGGSRWQTADGKATLDTISLPAGGETLQQLYDRAIVSGNPNRKVTYKLLRPDFFVVTGETPAGRFYRRMTLGPDGTMRGFSLGFDKALTTEMDRLTISIANSFEAFPQVASATTAAGQAAAVAAAVAAAAPSIPTMATTPGERLGSGLLVESGQVLTAIVVLKDCKAITIGARRVPARVLASDAQTGLGLLRAEGLMRTGPGLATAPIPAAGGTLTIVGQGWSGGASAGFFAEAIAVSETRIASPLQVGGAGAGVFSDTGALAGLVIEDPGTRRQVAGVVPVARYRIATGPEVGAFLGRNGITLPASMADKPVDSVAASWRDSVVPIVCTL